MGLFNRRKSTPQRTAQLKKIAFELEMDFTPVETYGMIKLLKGFKLFSKGNRKRILNLMVHSDTWHKVDVSIFDYYYTISTNNSSKTFKQTVFFIQSKQLGLPEFYMKPENWFHRACAFLGFEDIDFETFPQYSQQYYLKGDNEEMIRHSFNDKLLHFFTVQKEWSLEGVGYYLIFYKKHKLLPASKIKSFYRKGMEVSKYLEETTIEF